MRIQNVTLPMMALFVASCCSGNTGGKAAEVVETEASQEEDSQASKNVDSDERDDIARNGDGDRGEEVAESKAICRMEVAVGYRPPRETVVGRTTYIYDNRDNLLTKSEEVNPHGVVDNRFTYSYTFGNEGEVLGYEVVAKNNDRVVLHNKWSYLYDDNGNVVTKELDKNFDGSVDNRINLTYDSDGRVHAQESSLGSGRVYSRHVNTYDDKGNVLTREEDTDATGPMSKRSTFTNTYDDAGNLLTVEMRVAAGHDTYGNWITDGKVQERTVFTYNDEGEKLTAEVDNNADGYVDTRITYSASECPEGLGVSTVADTPPMDPRWKPWFDGGEGYDLTETMVYEVETCADKIGSSWSMVGVTQLRNTPNGVVADCTADIDGNTKKFTIPMVLDDRGFANFKMPPCPWWE